MCPRPKCYIPSFKVILPFGSGEDFLRFIPYMGKVAFLCIGRDSGDAINKLLFPLPTEAPHKIWL